MDIKSTLNEIFKSNKVAIHLDLPFGPPGFFDINKSVVLTWIIMGVFLVFCLMLTHNLKVHGCSRRQLLAETIVVKLRALVAGLIGKNGTPYIDWLICVLPI